MEIGTGTNVYVYALYSIVIYEFTFTQFQTEDVRTYELDFEASFSVPVVKTEKWALLLTNFLGT